LERKQIGVAVVGAGRIGTLRATMAAAHPAVRYLAVSDIERDRARKLAEKVGAQLWTHDLQRNGLENLFMTHEPALDFLKSQNETLHRALALIGMAKPFNEGR